LGVRASWGDYRLRSASPEEWVRLDRAETIVLDLTQANGKAREVDVPASDGLRIAFLARPVGALAAEAGVPPGARTVSVFIVNRRTPAPDGRKDEAFAFQVKIEVQGQFLPGRICAAWRVRTGTSALATCNIAMPASSPSATTSPPTLLL
jgi:hypothetical protein